MKNLLPLLCVLAVACGDNSDDQPGSGGGADGGAEAPAGALEGREYQGQGVAGETWIDGHVVGDGAPGTLQAQLDRSFDDFGARIEGSVLRITLPGADGSVFTIRRDTDASAIPGAVALDLEPGAATVSATGPGGFADADRGTVTISDCPKSSGDTVRGALQGLVLGGSEDRTWRMDLDFQVVVTSASGALECSTGGGGDGGDGGGGEPAQCPNTICEDPSFGCCPFDECLDDCQIITCRAVPCEGDEAACRHNCLQGCIDQCGITGSCLTAIQALWDCQLDSSCFDPDADVTEDACTRQSCCDAFTAVF